MNYLSKNDHRYGHANHKTGEISIRKGMDKKTKNAVIKHEKEHLNRGESGDFSLGAALGGSLIGGILGNKAASKQAAATQAAAQQASQAQLEGQRIATEEARRQFDLTRGDTATQRRVGDVALNYLSGALGPGGQFTPTAFDPGTFEESPGYQFQLEQGARARGAGLGAQGLRLSGRAQKELERYGQGVGAQEYGNWFNRQLAGRQQTEAERQNYLTRQFGLAGIGSQGIQTATGAGQQAAGQIGGAALGTGANLANIYSRQGQDLANIQGQRYGNLSGALTSGIQNYLAYDQQQKMNDLFANNLYGSGVSGDAYMPAYQRR